MTAFLLPTLSCHYLAVVQLADDVLEVTDDVLVVGTVSSTTFSVSSARLETTLSMRCTVSSATFPAVANEVGDRVLEDSLV